ncbi:MAG: HAD family hydrolase [Acinetobacter sp.]|nr:MAG: HAD family hydrolase [Acinetobacter sp.]
MTNIKVIAFDADDTLWVNEPYFREAEDKFCALLEDYLPLHSVAAELFKIEIRNLPLYGYGIKGFMLSMIETILEVTEGTASLEMISKAIEFGKEQLNKPIELLDGVEMVLEALKGEYRLVVATKGDLLDQERKLQKSGLEKYFHHIEIMSDKQERDYLKLLKHLDCKPEDFLMIGNSLKSDVLPVLQIGGNAVHVPYHTTWAHEVVENNVAHENFSAIPSIDEILNILKK